MKESDWQATAFDVYRLAWGGLEDWRKLQNPDLEFWIEDLREALLDLKEATIAQDEARAMQHLNEVTMLMAELIRRTGGTHE